MICECADIIAQAGSFGSLKSQPRRLLSFNVANSLQALCGFHLPVVNLGCPLLASVPTVTT